MRAGSPSVLVWGDGRVWRGILILLHERVRREQASQGVEGERQDSGLVA